MCSRKVTQCDLQAGLLTVLLYRYRFCAAVLKQQLYVIGGMAVFEPANATKHVVSDRVMRYTPATNTWEILPGVLFGELLACA